MPIGGSPLSDFIYVEEDDVFNYLRITDYSDTEKNIVHKYLEWARDEVDEMIGSTYGVRESREEVHSLSYPYQYRWYMVGCPFFVRYAPIVKILSMKVWNGGEYEEWIGKYNEGRLGMYWIDADVGRVFLATYLYRAGGEEVKVKYWYGFGNAIDNGDGTYSVEVNAPSYAKKYSLLYAARLFISSEFMVQRVAEGGAEDLRDLLARIDKEIEYYREILQSYSINAGEFIA